MYLFAKRSHYYKDKYNARLSKQEIKNIVSNDLINDVYSNYNHITDKKVKVEMKILSLCFILSKMILFMIHKHQK